MDADSAKIRRSEVRHRFFRRTIGFYSVLEYFRHHTNRYVVLENASKFRTKLLGLFYIRAHANLQIRKLIYGGMIIHQFNGDPDE
ncbi:MAG: hypothetical protein JNM81_15885 [Rhodospirillaceae bacterium]|nr:hypothetical protein [Rhodospirillaceae bacterium]